MEQKFRIMVSIPLNTSFCSNTDYTELGSGTKYLHESSEQGDCSCFQESEDWREGRMLAVKPSQVPKDLLNE